MSGVAQAVEELTALGYEPTVDEDRVNFPYVIEAGKWAGQKITLGLTIPPEFNRVPPSGPRFSPRLQPINPGGQHPDRAHPADEYGPDWQYWSRPFKDWSKTDRSMKSYLTWVRTLFAQT